MSTLETRIQSVVDDHLIRTFWEAAAHFKTDDLVVFLDEQQQAEPLTVSPRITVVDAPEVPDAFRIKLRKPPRDAAVRLRDSDASFWLVVNFADGQSACAAINAKPLAPGGSA